MKVLPPRRICNFHSDQTGQTLTVANNDKRTVLTVYYGFALLMHNYLFHSFFYFIYPDHEYSYKEKIARNQPRKIYRPTELFCLLQETKLEEKHFSILNYSV